MSEQNELALVLSRIQALSKSKATAAGMADTAIDQNADDGIPVLTEIYQDQDALTAVEWSQVFVAESPASAVHDSTLGHAVSEQGSTVNAVVEANPQAEPLYAGLSSDSSIRFLPVDDGNAEAMDGLQDPVREELVAAVLEDIQPVMSDVIRQALIREVQVLGPRISAELEAALSENVRQRVLGALRNEKSNKE